MFSFGFFFFCLFSFFFSQKNPSKTLVISSTWNQHSSLDRKSEKYPQSNLNSSTSVLFVQAQRFPFLTAFLTNKVQTGLFGGLNLKKFVVRV